MSTQPYCGAYWQLFGSFGGLIMLRDVWAPGNSLPILVRDTRANA
ncbi:hypothetical protein [Ruegeria sp. HKCCD7318]|nr:hypothetical protein [Ruegeria sp. HKCCD7318]